MKFFILRATLTFGEGGGGGGGYTVGADILSSADWYHHSIICSITYKYNRQGNDTFTSTPGSMADGISVEEENKEKYMKMLTYKIPMQLTVVAEDF